MTRKITIAFKKNKPESPNYPLALLPHSALEVFCHVFKRILKG